MAYSVETTAGYDDRFDRALAWRLENVGRRSALELLDAEDLVETELADFPCMGVPLDRSLDDASGDVPRWVFVGPYIAVYETIEGEGRVVLEDLFHPSQNWRDLVS